MGCLVCMWATNQCSRATCWWRRRFHGQLSPSLFRCGQMRPADPTGGLMKRHLHILKPLAKLLRNLLGRRKKYRTMLIPRPDRIWWCTRNISAGGDALNRTAMKALKMSIIHVVAFVISWTPYAIMGTWSVSQKLKHRHKDPVWILFCQGHHRQGFPAKHFWQGFN